jgi:protein-tyrosine-phosphatase
LFVCSGNTCRSPLAAALARRLVDAHGLDVSVASAGTGAIDGAPASDGSMVVGLERGVDLSSHRARLLTRELVDVADLLLCMATQHLERVRELGGDAKAFLLTDYAAARPVGRAINDPFGGAFDGYRRMADELERELSGVIDRLSLEQSTRGAE